MTAPRLARRLEHIEPFYVMELAKVAARMAASPACDPAQGGEPMVFLNIGEPDFTAPPAVLAAAAAAGELVVSGGGGSKVVQHAPGAGSVGAECEVVLAQFL
jgi:aspartate/methionine/tyrosine aminotransferase